jgi:hypothetical protein
MRVKDSNVVGTLVSKRVVKPTSCVRIAQYSFTMFTSLLSWKNTKYFTPYRGFKLLRKFLRKRFHLNVIRGRWTVALSLLISNFDSGRTRFCLPRCYARGLVSFIPRKRLSHLWHSEPTLVAFLHLLHTSNHLPQFPGTTHTTAAPWVSRRVRLSLFRQRFSDDRNPAHRRLSKFRCYCSHWMSTEFRVLIFTVGGILFQLWRYSLTKINQD